MAVGQNVLRKEGYEKLTGAARYMDDIALDGMLFGKTIRSTIARGRVKSITFDPSYDWSRWSSPITATFRERTTSRLSRTINRCLWSLKSVTTMNRFC